MRLITFLILIQLSIVNYGQIIADHTVVGQYDKIPQEYINEVKKMWLSYAGESHALGILKGLELLESADARYAVNITDEGDPESFTDNYLRASKAKWGEYSIANGWQYTTGETDWWTNSTAVSRVKAGLTYANSVGIPHSAIGYGWCWDATEGTASAGTDPVYDVHWFGRSKGSPEGDKCWGINDADNVVSGNSVNMDTYISATQSYIDYCADSIPTTVFFTTGPVDILEEGYISDESLYQGYLKWEHLRNYVNANGGVLFDYADILCYDDGDTEPNTITWNGNTFPAITSDNAFGQYAHISYAGCIRLAKAMWWMLARIAGWDGNTGGEDTTPPSVPSGLILNAVTVNFITISWNASTDNVGVTGYRVYRDGSLIGSTSASTLSYTDNIVSGCNTYTYSVSALDAAGNESAQSTGLAVSNCPPDLTPTLIVTPNISHGVTAFDVIVRITELNIINTGGTIAVNIPKDTKWDLDGSFSQSLSVLSGFPLNNNVWTYASDATNHIFTTSASIPAGSYSTFGFTISFNPDASRGEYTITSQVVTGGGGELLGSNNSDSERLDYFQE